MKAKFISFLQKNVGTVLLIAALVLGSGVLFLYERGTIFAAYPEVSELSATDWSFQEYSDYFRKLSDTKSAEYAYQVLLRATLPSGLDLHLLGHVIGDMLYMQKGITGINSCTDDFRNACSHSVVIGVLNDEGEGALPKIAETCKEAPGGAGAYTMCFHGLGHGVLAFNGYNFEKAVAMCRKTGTPEFNDREYIECVGGATMEMIAGVHDRTAWESQVPNYFKDNDPLYPCDADFMPPEVRPICYTHLTPHLFEAAGANLGNPDPKFYETSFSYCSTLPEDDRANREACYGGFGKEFVVFARGRDIRDIGSSEKEPLKKTREWCALAHQEQGERDCNGYALASLFWGGENNPDASFLYCELAEGQAQEECYAQLTDHIIFYLSGDIRGTQLCARLPDPFKSTCLSRMH